MAPDPSPNMTEQSDKATGFFSLPRELRDKIYDMVREDHRVKKWSVDFEFRAAIPEKRLVSRQFKSEYDQRSAVNTFVHIFDIFNMCAFEHFPRLAIKSCYLELAWTTENAYDMPSDDDPNVLDETLGVSLEERMRSLQKLVGHLPETKDVHVEVFVLQPCNLKNTMDGMIACPVLTSIYIKSPGFIHFKRSASGDSRSCLISFVPWSCAKDNVDLAIWSREQGFLVDNTDEKKGMQETDAARERYLKREAAAESREAESRVSGALQSSNGTGEHSLDSYAGGLST